MDAYEATKIVFQRIQTLDPQNASKIMGVLLIQDHGEKEMIRLAFGPESQLHSVILKARKELNFATPNMPSTPSTPSSPSPFSHPFSLSRQNSCSSAASSRLINGGSVNLLSLANQSASSWSNSSCFSDFQNSSTPDDLISPDGTYNNGGGGGTSLPSAMNTSAAPFYGGGGEVDLIDELQFQDQLSFLNDDPSLFPSYGGACDPRVTGVDGMHHRRSCSVSDICGGDELGRGFGWKPCLFYARGYCKNGTSCRFLHGEGGVAADGGIPVCSPGMFEGLEQCHELLRSKSAQSPWLMNGADLGSTNFAYSPPLPVANKCMDFLLQQQFPPESPRDLLRSRLVRGDFGLNGVNPGSRQIYLTFPADSTFKEEDVSNYFSNFGPVQDVRIPYQQKRMFGFVTFDYPETVKLILAKGNPHFVCDARVLVKPYKEKGKIPDKHRKQQQQMERGEFTGCGSPTGLDSRDPFDLQLGARMLYNTRDILWRRKLEEQAELQQAIELQTRRFMGLHLLDVNKRINSHHRTLSTGSVISSSPTYSPTYFNQNGVISSNRSSPDAKEENGVSIGAVGNRGHAAAAAADEHESQVAEREKNSSASKESSPKESDVDESLEHNLPASPFASPKAAVDYTTVFSNDTLETEKGNVVISAPPANNNTVTGPSSLFPVASPLDIAAPFKSCYFQVPRFASGHEAIGM